MQVNCFPVWVVSRVERPAVHVKFIREHQRQLLIRIHIWWFGIYIFWRFTIYEAEVAWHVRDLARRVDSTEIEATLRRL